VKPVRTHLTIVALALSALVLSAAPAGASTGVVVATDQFKWFYWIGVILAVSLALWLIVTAIGYYVRVMRPKYRGRHQS
jgi:hypothetical protein